MKKNDKKFGGGCASNVGIKRADPRHHQHDWYNMDVFTYNISLQGRFLPPNPNFDRSFGRTLFQSCPEVCLELRKLVKLLTKKYTVLSFDDQRSVE